MKPLMNTTLGEIEDESIHLLMQDLCEMLCWRQDDFRDYSFFDFLGVIIREKREMVSLDHIAIPRVLDQKLEKLRDLGIFQLCRELKNNDTSQVRGEVTLFSFLQQHLAELQTPERKSAPLTDAEFKARIIRTQRENGSL
jgi:hypothetical protein